MTERYANVGTVIGSDKTARALRTIIANDREHQRRIQELEKTVADLQAQVRELQNR